METGFGNGKILQTQDAFHGCKVLSRVPRDLSDCFLCQPCDVFLGEWCCRTPYKNRGGSGWFWLPLGLPVTIDDSFFTVISGHISHGLARPAVHGCLVKALLFFDTTLQAAKLASRRLLFIKESDVSLPRRDQTEVFPVAGGGYSLVAACQAALVVGCAGMDDPAFQVERKHTIHRYPLAVVFAGDVDVRTGGISTLAGGETQRIARFQHLPKPGLSL